MGSNVQGREPGGVVVVVEKEKVRGCFIGPCRIEFRFASATDSSRPPTHVPSPVPQDLQLQLCVHTLNT